MNALRRWIEIPAAVVPIFKTIKLTLAPRICSEFYTDWYLNWNKTIKPGDHNRSSTQLVNNLSHMYHKWNASVNIYMIHGGTNFAFNNGNTDDGPVSFMGGVIQGRGVFKEKRYLLLKYLDPNFVLVKLSD